MGATPTMNRSAKDGERSSPHYGGEGVTHSPIEPRCLLAARYGRFMRDPRRPVGVLALNQVSDPISESEMGSDAPPGVGDAPRPSVVSVCRRWVVHCRNEQEAQALKAELQARLAECRLEMH